MADLARDIANDLRGLLMVTNQGVIPGLIREDLIRIAERLDQVALAQVNTTPISNASLEALADADQALKAASGSLDAGFFAALSQLQGVIGVLLRKH